MENEKIDQILLDSFRSALLCCDGTLADFHRWWRREYNLMYTEFVNDNLNKPSPNTSEVDLPK